jgi:hypothetical protein
MSRMSRTWAMASSLCNAINVAVHIGLYAPPRKAPGPLEPVMLQCGDT